MAFKKSYKSRPRRKRRYVRRKRHIPQTGPGKLAVRLKYAEKFTIDPTILGGPGVYMFSANSLYDPNETGTGHQPRGFDQYMELYTKFCVIATSIRLDYKLSAGDSFSQIVGISLKNTSNSLGSIEAYKESRNTIHRMVAGGDGMPARSMTFKCKPHKFLGISHPLSDDQMKGSALSDPTNECFFHIFTAPVEAVDATYLQCSVTIDYTVIFTEPKLPTVS